MTRRFNLLCDNHASALEMLSNQSLGKGRENYIYVSIATKKMNES